MYSPSGVIALNMQELWASVATAIAKNGMRSFFIVRGLVFGYFILDEKVGRKVARGGEILGNSV